MGDDGRRGRANLFMVANSFFRSCARVNTRPIPQQTTTHAWSGHCNFKRANKSRPFFLRWMRPMRASHTYHSHCKLSPFFPASFLPAKFHLLTDTAPSKIPLHSHPLAGPPRHFHLQNCKRVTCHNLLASPTPPPATSPLSFLNELAIRANAQTHTIIRARAHTNTHTQT